MDITATYATIDYRIGDSEFWDMPNGATAQIGCVETEISGTNQEAKTRTAKHKISSTFEESGTKYKAEFLALKVLRNNVLHNHAGSSIVYAKAGSEWVINPVPKQDKAIPVDSLFDITKDIALYYWTWFMERSITLNLGEGKKLIDNKDLKHIFEKAWNSTVERELINATDASPRDEIRQLLFDI